MVMEVIDIPVKKGRFSLFGCRYCCHVFRSREQVSTHEKFHARDLLFRSKCPGISPVIGRPGLNVGMINLPDEQDKELQVGDWLNESLMLLHCDSCDFTTTQRRILTLHRKAHETDGESHLLSNRSFVLEFLLKKPVVQAGRDENNNKGGSVEDEKQTPDVSLESLSPPSERVVLMDQNSPQEIPGSPEVVHIQGSNCTSTENTMEYTASNDTVVPLEMQEIAGEVIISPRRSLRKSGQLPNVQKQSEDPPGFTRFPRRRYSRNSSAIPPVSKPLKDPVENAMNSSNTIIQKDPETPDTAEPPENSPKVVQRPCRNLSKNNRDAKISERVPNPLGSASTSTDMSVHEVPEDNTPSEDPSGVKRTLRKFLTRKNKCQSRIVKKTTRDSADKVITYPETNIQQDSQDYKPPVDPVSTSQHISLPRKSKAIRKDSETVLQPVGKVTNLSETNIQQGPSYQTSPVSPVSISSRISLPRKSKIVQKVPDTLPHTDDKVTNFLETSIQQGSSVQMSAVSPVSISSRISLPRRSKVVQKVPDTLPHPCDKVIIFSEPNLLQDLQVCTSPEDTVGGNTTQRKKRFRRNLGVPIVPESVPGLLSNDSPVTTVKQDTEVPKPPEDATEMKVTPRRKSCRRKQDVPEISKSVVDSISTFTNLQQTAEEEPELPEAPLEVNSNICDDILETHREAPDKKCRGPLLDIGWDSPGEPRSRLLTCSCEILEKCSVCTNVQISLIPMIIHVQ